MTPLAVPGVPTVVVRWVHSYAGKQFWKCSGFIDFDDLLQEGYYAISYCLNRYGCGLDPPHFMRLVQLYFTQVIIDIAKKRTRLSETHDTDFVEPEQTDYFWSKVLGSDTQAELNRVISEAPELVRKALIFLANDEGAMRAPYKKAADGTRETTSGRLSKHLGLTAPSPVMDQVRAYLA